MIRRCLRFSLSAPLLVVLLLLFYSDLPSAPRFAAPLACAAAVFISFTVLAVPRFSFRLLGAGLCVLPMFGASVLSLFVTAWMLAYELHLLARHASQPAHRADAVFLLGVLIFFLALLLSGVHAMFLDEDLLVLASIVDGGGWSGLLRYAAANAGHWTRIPVFVAGFVSAGLLVFLVVASHRVERGLNEILLGVIVGLFLSLIILGLQYLDVHPIFSLSRAEIWRRIGRYSGSFSDPNAFATAAVLAIPAVIFSTKGWYRICAVLVSSASLAVLPLSGSRTVWLAVGLWAVLLTVRVLRKRTGAVTLTAASGIALCLAAIVFVLGSPPINDALCGKMPESGISRALRTIHWTRGREMLSSRLIYGRIALRVWRENPLIGAGLARFYGQQDAAAKSIGIDLEDWRDNANNYYLQVLAEQGLIGLFLVLFSFYLMNRALSGPPAADRVEADDELLGPPATVKAGAAAALAIFALLLLTGPHLFFQEVRYLTALIFALALAASENCEGMALRRYKRQALVVAGLCPVLFMVLLARAVRSEPIRGFYRAEHSDSEGRFAWTGRTAFLRMCPARGSGGLLQLRAGNPDIERNPLGVVIWNPRAPAKPIGEILFKDHNWRQVPLRLAADAPAMLRIDSSRIWSPSEGNPAGDARWLGVMLKWPADVCPGF